MIKSTKTHVKTRSKQGLSVHNVRINVSQWFPYNFNSEGVKVTTSNLLSGTVLSGFDPPHKLMVNNSSSVLPTTAPTRSYGASLAGYQHDTLPFWHHKVHLAEAFITLSTHPTVSEPFCHFFFISSTHIPAVSVFHPVYGFSFPLFFLR